MTTREEMEHEIWWQVKSGNSSFWFDNWTTLGALYFIEAKPMSNEKSEFKDFIKNGGYDINKSKEVLSEELVEFIADNISPPIHTKLMDKVWWMGEVSGNFSIKSPYRSLSGKNSYSNGQRQSG